MKRVVKNYSWIAHNGASVKLEITREGLRGFWVKAEVNGEVRGYTSSVDGIGLCFEPEFGDCVKPRTVIMPPYEIMEGIRKDRLLLTDEAEALSENERLFLWNTDDIY